MKKNPENQDSRKTLSYIKIVDETDAYIGKNGKKFSGGFSKDLLPLFILGVATISLIIGAFGGMCFWEGLR